METIQTTTIDMYVDSIYAHMDTTRKLFVQWMHVYYSRMSLDCSLYDFLFDAASGNYFDIHNWSLFTEE